MVYKAIPMAKIIVVLVALAFIVSVSTEVVALERQLAGIDLGKPANFVLKKYGNPDRVIVGNTSPMPASPFQASPMPGAPGAGPGPMPIRDVSPFAGLSGVLPGLSSIGGMPGSQPFLAPSSPAPQTGSNNTPAPEEDIRWSYDLPKGPTIEFIVDDGVVAQITVSGSKFAGAKTSKGVILGDNYKKVLMTYGYPDKQEYVGRYLRVGYLQKSNIMFTLRDSKTVVGITIGLKE